jgi:hypothetical protein
VIITAAQPAAVVPKSHRHRKTDRDGTGGKRRKNPLPGTSPHVVSSLLRWNTVLRTGTRIEVTYP